MKEERRDFFKLLGAGALTVAGLNLGEKSVMADEQKKFTEIASGLEFPEGPIAMPDGSLILVEIKSGHLTRINVDGSLERLIHLGGGPNGAALGPDGRIYVCNNGGFEWYEADGFVIPGHMPASYTGGSIQAVDLATGKVETLYTQCNGNPLRGPNDIVFDKQGGFWFTDHGKTQARSADTTGVYYAKIDGSFISEQIFPLSAPNGIGLSPDEKTLYVAETMTGRIWHHPIEATGQVKKIEGLGVDRLLYTAPGGYELYDSLAIDAEGNVVVASLITAGIRTISPKGELVDFYQTDDILTTNICFGGKNLKTAYITLSGTGRVIKVDWPRPGLALNFLNI